MLGNICGRRWGLPRTRSRADRDLGWRSAARSGREFGEVVHVWACFLPAHHFTYQINALMDHQINNLTNISTYDRIIMHETSHQKENGRKTGKNSYETATCGILVASSL